ncbi:hypothetical protein ACFE04_019723 [Oxalis oulophora]
MEFPCLPHAWEDVSIPHFPYPVKLLASGQSINQEYTFKLLLGLGPIRAPRILTRVNKETFASIVPRMKVKLQGCKDFQNTFLYDVDKGQKDFLWSNPEGSNKMNLVGWPSLFAIMLRKIKED